MRRHWLVIIGCIVGFLIGITISRGIRPQLDTVAELTEFIEALEFIETIERVELPENGEWARCVRVIDGDTIEVEFVDGTRPAEKVRYIGIDTPETVHPSREIEPYGPEASAINKSLVEGKWIYLVTDVTDRDRYERLLRYVYTVDGLFVNLALVACGLAQVSTYPPDVAHVDEYLAAQEAAREAGRGMWEGLEEVSEPPESSGSGENRAGSFQT